MKKKHNLCTLNLLFLDLVALTEFHKFMIHGLISIDSFKRRT